MFNNTICVIDLETTGTFEEEKFPRITEIGVVKISKDLEVIDTFQSYINPEEPLSEFIVKYTGITDLMLASAPKFREIADELTYFLDGKNSTLSAWPISFDIPLLQREYARAGLKFPLERRSIDIGTLSSLYLIKNNIELKLAPGTTQASYSLNNILHTIGISMEGKRHSALDDAMVETEALIYVLKKLYEN